MNTTAGPAQGAVDSGMKQNLLAAWGPWIAMTAAVVLTAKGEFDLAVLAHFDETIAWMFPVMIDVYVITAFHRRRRKDMIISALLMIFCQIAVHLLPVYITEGEQTPWGLVVAVACIAPIVVVRVKMLTGRTAAEIAAGQHAAQREDELRAAQAEIAGLRRQLTDTRAQAETEIGRASAEAQARQVAETRAAEAEAQIAQAETRAAAEAETRAEIEAAAKAEIGRAEAAAAAAERRAIEQAELARIAQGQLAEARETADRAMVARVVAEQGAAGQVERLTTAAEQIQAQLQARIEQASAAADSANEQVTALGERVRTLQAQLTEAREYGERQSTSKVRTEQLLAGLQAERDDALAELEQTRLAAATEIERLGRQLARASERAEIASGRQAEISRGPGRKSLAAVPGALAGNLPVVETVAPETVATVLVAWAETPEATQAELRERTGISDRTIRKVLKAIPAEIAGEVAGQVLALTDGRAA
ncbi:coiled-coil domain-containing protein [Actinoplanes siamensis]|uniref:DUF2637 domain-containing protein n=1 Tax=Actinoplanes siamensis TaxID=1223317 RepID=A0A919TPG8_9ACTN|nr:hypothetical protein [Actinoplanes siamensis]GIF08875.1 hypothetical protein Asi03nite_64130 [Actinoplanes siamensis]